MSPESITERFITLETKVAYQENLIADLNHVIIGQSRSLDLVELRLKRLEERLKEDADGRREFPVEKPPHY